MASLATQSAPAAASNAASHPYTCNTCQVAYRNIDLQKGHMKSDWQYVQPPLSLSDTSSFENRTSCTNTNAPAATT